MIVKFSSKEVTASITDNAGNAMFEGICTDYSVLIDVDALIKDSGSVVELIANIGKRITTLNPL